MHLFLVFVEMIKCTLKYQEAGISRDKGDWHKHDKDLCGLLRYDVPLTWQIRTQGHNLKTVYAIPLNIHNFMTYLLNTNLTSRTNEKKYSLSYHFGKFPSNTIGGIWILTIY